jgi:hypothetical protein
METYLIGFYFTVFIVVSMIAYAGIKETLTVFLYLYETLNFKLITLKLKYLEYKHKKYFKKHSKIQDYVQRKNF